MKILITPKLNHSKKKKEYSIDINWFSYIKKIGYESEMIDLINFDKKLNTKDIKAVIFSGGNDLYKFNKRIENYLRDEYEKKIISKCLKNKIKIIGICRGFQIIAEYFGGKIEKIENHVKKNTEYILIKKKV